MLLRTTGARTVDADEIGEGSISFMRLDDEDPSPDVRAGDTNGGHAVHASAALLALIDDHPGCVCVIDTDGRIVRCSAGAEYVLADARPLIGRSFADVARLSWSAAMATARITSVRDALVSASRSSSIGTSSRNADATVAAGDWRAFEVQIEDGRPGVVCIFGGDRLDDSPHQRLRRVRSASEAAGLGIWSWLSTSDTVIWENDQPYEILGIPRGAPPVTAAEFETTFVLPAYRACFAATRQGAAGQHAPIRFHGPIRRRDGATRWVEILGEHLPESEPGSGRYLGTIRDITNRKVAEEQIRETEERSAFVRQSSGVGFWYCDLPFSVLQWDDLVKAHFHLPPDAVVTMDTFYDRLHPDDRDMTRVAIERSMAEKTQYRVDYRTVHPDSGEISVIRAIGRTFYADDGTPSRFDGITLDVTEQKRTESELRAADRRKDEFLATLCHELRNPLAPIRNGLELLRLVKTHDTIEATRSMMDRQLTQLVRLVDDLLDVNRVNSNKVQLRRTHVALRDIVTAAIETSRTVVEGAGHRLSVVLPDEPVWLYGDATRLAQVVSNLLHNSAKYTHVGGHIAITVTCDADAVVISVKDTGIGIPSDMLATVFTMFSQVDRALEKTTGGLGIGLALVKGLVELHGGRVEARSAGDNAGSEFLVWLPAAGPPTSIRQSAGEQPRQTVAHRRILIADDSVDAAESLARLLETAGHDVRVAHDGVEAVDVAAEFRPDLVILDIGMPRLNGYDAARRIRAEPWGRSATLVALTGWGQSDHRTQSAAAGFDHHLVKPVVIDELTAVISARGR